MFKQERRAARQQARNLARDERQARSYLAAAPVYTERSATRTFAPEYLYAPPLWSPADRTGYDRWINRDASLPYRSDVPVYAPWAEAWAPVGWSSPSYGYVSDYYAQPYQPWIGTGSSGVTSGLGLLGGGGLSEILFALLPALLGNGLGFDGLGGSLLGNGVGLDGLSSGLLGGTAFDSGYPETSYYAPLAGVDRGPYYTGEPFDAAAAYDPIYGGLSGDSLADGIGGGGLIGLLGGAFGDGLLGSALGGLGFDETGGLGGLLGGSDEAFAPDPFLAPQDSLLAQLGI